MTGCCSSSWRCGAPVFVIKDTRNIRRPYRHWRHCRKSDEDHWKGTSAARSVQPCSYIGLPSRQAFDGGTLMASQATCVVSADHRDYYVSARPHCQAVALCSQPVSLFVCLFVLPFVRLIPTSEHDVLKINEPILMPMWIECGPWDKAMNSSTLWFRRLKVKITWV